MKKSISQRHFSRSLVASAILVAWGWHATSWAQVVIEESLNGGTSKYPWIAINGACLTAGDNSGGTLPACIAPGSPARQLNAAKPFTYYNGRALPGGVNGSLPDPAGKGALRLTNGDTTLGGGNGDWQNGSVVSNFTFPTDLGIQVTFKTVTYGGDGAEPPDGFTSSANGSGADGMTFYLMDGSEQPSVGDTGGALGYACLNNGAIGNVGGVSKGYLGIGIDEFGNFSNRIITTNTGAGQFGTTKVPGAIVLRGAGNLTWPELTRRYPSYYTDAATPGEKASILGAICSTGNLYRWIGGNFVDTKERVAANLTYDYITGVKLPDTVKMSNQQGVAAPKRGEAVPISYTLRITEAGVLDMSYAVNGGSPISVITGRKITDSNGPLPSSFRFGFAASTGGGSNIHEVTCFKAAPANFASTSAGANAQQTAQIRVGTQVYLAMSHPVNWWGQMTAQDLIYDASKDTVSIKQVANWDASCTLTGGACASTGSTTTAQDPANRTMLTWSGSAGTPFTWSAITQAQKDALTAGDFSANSNRLQYLRGDRTRELSAGGGFRNRTGVFGDVQGSNPTWVGAPSSPYAGPWIDKLNSTATAPEGLTYASFRSANTRRQNIVYVGANDGFLHGFRAGGYDASGNFVNDATTPNDGKEVLAYIPAAALETIHSTNASLDYSDARYSHNYYVDASPGTGDLFYNNAWHTWLVGGLGAGGNKGGPINDRTTTATGAIYALDITNPSAFTEGNAASLVVGEWTSATLSCENLTDCGKHLGSAYGTPAIRRLHNGHWAVLFGNGLNSSTGAAGLFVMIVDAQTGAKTFRYIDTGATGTSTKNGIVSVTPADLDGDHITDYVYAGDVQGNLWRFDLTNSDPSRWAASTYPLFATASGQPITTKVTVASIPAVQAGRSPRVIVAFGTGEQRPQTLTSGAVYASGTQSLYGVWDYTLSNWNSKSASGNKFETGSLLTGQRWLDPSNLATQTVTAATSSDGSNATSYRSVTNAKVCWSGSTICASNNTQYGWRVDLPATAEQVIYSPVTAYGMFIVNTTIPGADRALSCDPVGPTGYTMAVTMAGGGAPARSFFADPSGGFDFAGYGNAIIAGVGLNATGSPYLTTAGTGTLQRPYLVQQTTDGTGAVAKINPGFGGTGGRLNWIKLR